MGERRAEYLAVFCDHVAFGDLHAPLGLGGVVPGDLVVAPRRSRRHIVRQIEVPDTHLRCLDRDGQESLGVTQRGFDLFALGNIGDDRKAIAPPASF